jgi:hypothetical protein
MHTVVREFKNMCMLLRQASAHYHQLLQCAAAAAADNCKPN